MCKSGDSDACKWRHAHLEFLKKKLPQVSVKDEEGKLTYMQLLEMAKKDCGVSSPRERNLLNIMAFMHQPLTRSELVLEALTKLSLFYVRVLERMRIVLGSRSDRARIAPDLAWIACNVVRTSARPSDGASSAWMVCVLRLLASQGCGF